MGTIKEYIKSGIIESYVLGLSTPSESREVEEMAVIYDEVRTAIEEFSEALEEQAFNNAIAPDPIVKPMVLATIDFITRREHGEAARFVPMLSKHSKITDYSEWLERTEMTLPIESDDVYARIINHSAEVTTAIVWIKVCAPPEEHANEIERFLVVEGSCEIIVEEHVYELTPGDFFEIPLFKSHMVKVTSQIPCKVILQRVAA